MGTQGEDVWLSAAARAKFPYAVECKNVERVNVWQCWGQAQTNAAHAGLKPLLVLARNRTKPVVVIDIDHFLELYGELKTKA